MTQWSPLFNGLPAFIEVPEMEGYEGDIPAVSVSLADGTATDEDFDETLASRIKHPSVLGCR
ncbi:phage minor tail U family protein [Vibrio cortegadensis]|uniref:phage minor tail U family protein n=1 Tax=Vibrio cortegadensis TaxID=1328770 RepID=UPI0021C41716|nr:phage minor tail U family protein [Vibrio cortegadensis]